MTRSISAELLAAQQGNYRPAINLVFHDRDDNNTEDFSFAVGTSNRLIQCQFHEYLYDDYGFVVLRNNDLAIPDLKGWWVEPGFGADTSVGGFGGSGEEYEKIRRYWVTNQQKISAPGNQIVILQFEGIWRRMMRHLMLTLGISPVFGATMQKTIYDILEFFIEENLKADVASSGDRAYMASTLEAIGDQSDTIIDIITVFFDLNEHYIESVGEIMQRAQNLTKCYLRVKKGMVFEVRYPQTSDSGDATYY
ncbi:hypothetical protein LCGC14_2464760, partial [marine sediment metagenome]